jgi:ABC-type molybdenum transport system ATPase subunit/photorepair protein PhrA
MLRTLAGASRAAYFLRATRCATFVRPQSTERETNHGTLLELDHVVLSYPNSTKTTLGPLNFTIVHPSSGGHALFGKNGSGKSLLAYTLASLEKENRQESKYLRSGSYSTEDRWHSRAIAKVSFQSHEELLKQGGTVSKAISDGGNLSKAAKFLIVRFGIYHLLYRQVET